LKAWVLHKIGDLRFEEVPIPEIKAGEALLKVKYAGICSSDLPRIFTELVRT
jgi:L-iditol 2-dehydrogenase